MTTTTIQEEYTTLWGVQTRRLFLPTIGVVGLLVFDSIRNFIYLPVMFTFIGFILFWNFPIFIYFTHSKPLYVDDLFVDSTKLPKYILNNDVKKKYMSILNWTLIIVNSLFIGALSDFWLYKTYKLNSFMEIIGVTGGIFKIFQIFNSVITGCVLYVAQKYIVNVHISTHTEIEMTTMNPMVDMCKQQINPLTNEIIHRFDTTHK